MQIKKLFYLLILLVTFSCSEDNDVSVARNLQEYVSEISEIELSSVIAFAANAKDNVNLNYIFYYPESGATDIRYYETENTSVDEKDFANYRRLELTNEAVFGGKLARFSRNGNTETWCLVTFMKEGKLLISDPIRLKNNTKTTEYSDDVSIEYKTKTAPNFSWKDGTHKENVIYFQVISDEDNNFISGTYTEETFFQYYDTSNVILDINTKAPQNLVEDELYHFTMMGVSEDNWVNLIIEEQFIPRNLEEYVATNTNYEEDILAFASNANANKEITYIYFNPITSAFDFRYYETENTSVDKTDFKNYKRRSLSNEVLYGGRLRRFTHNSPDEVWCLVTYIVGDKLHISTPIKTKNSSRTTQYKTEVSITYPETLKPKFTWNDGVFAENTTYLQVLTKADKTFLSGTFTTEKTFQYYVETNVTKKIHTTTPPNLVLDDEYKFDLYGISDDNWVNLVIQKSFVVQ